MSMIEDEQYYDIPSDDFNVPYVTLEQMHELLPDTKLELDEQTGLYYTDFRHASDSNLLRAHYLVEMLMEEPDKVDWAKVTHRYSKYYIEYIEYLYENPLVWVEQLPDNHPKDVVVIGKIAQEKSSYERNCCSPYDMFFTHMFYDDRTLWFADNLPSTKDFESYAVYQQDFTSWDYLTQEKGIYGLHEDEKPHVFDIDNFLRNINFIAQKRGGAKAAQIVRLFRKEWNGLVALKLFNIDTLTREQIEEFRACLFEGMEYYLEQWDAEKPKLNKPKKEKLPSPKYITFKMGNITHGHLQMLRLKLIDTGWIANDTQPDDFDNLFSGKLNNAKITWTGSVGKGMLVFLFTKMAEQQLIIVPENHSITTILENHFTDANGKALSGLNSSKESLKHIPVVKECIDILLLDPNND